eukprot:m.125048 g.125048  ORF g.125048 m.125048 type:complete len:91 (-) comp14485_c0_seq3:1810-2082(-)
MCAGEYSTPHLLTSTVAPPATTKQSFETSPIAVKSTSSTTDAFCKDDNAGFALYAASIGLNQFTECFNSPRWLCSLQDSSGYPVQRYFVE